MLSLPLKVLFSILFIILAYTLSIPTTYAFAPFSLNNLGERIIDVNITEHAWESEMTPQVLKQPNGKYIYLFTGSSSYFCEYDKPILSGVISIPKDNCKFFSKAMYIKDISREGNLSFEPSQLSTTYDWPVWRMIYDGVVTFHLIDVNNESRLIAVKHGESTNSAFFNSATGEEYMYQNKIYTNVPVNSYYVDTENKVHPTGCYSGYKPGVDETGKTITVYNHCWDSFTSFVHLSWAKYDKNIGLSSLKGWDGNLLDLSPASTNRTYDEGPILWPRNGYKNAQGLPQPGATFYLSSSYIKDDYIYVFSVDWDCLRLARAPVNQGGAYWTWKFYSDSTKSFTVNSLPSGYNPQQIGNYYSVGGINYHCEKLPNEVTSFSKYPNYKIVGINHPYFRVATLKEGGWPKYYVASTETTWDLCPSNNLNCDKTEKKHFWGFGIRISSDLIHWSPAVYFQIVEGEWGYGGGRFAYPTFINKEGTTNFELDREDFYLLGKNADNGLDPINGHKNNLIRFSLTCNKPNKTTGMSVNGTALSTSSQNPVNLRYKEKYTLNWNKIDNAVKYAFRLDYPSSAHCNHANDYCNDGLTTTSYVFKPVPNTTYTTWVAGVGYCDHWSDWGDSDVYSLKVAKKGDFNLDNLVNSTDFTNFSKNLFSSSHNRNVYDVNVDNKINLVDLVISL